MKKWTIDDSKELYNINGWGTSYFGINEKGDVYVTPCKNGTQIDLREVMDELALRDVTPPVLLRFPDILDNRIEKTWSCFKKASEEYDYKGENYVVYPIKVNQMQPVVEEIISHGRKFNLGLEAGSKPELHAVIAMQCQSVHRRGEDERTGDHRPRGQEDEYPSEYRYPHQAGFLWLRQMGGERRRCLEVRSDECGAFRGIGIIG